MSSFSSTSTPKSSSFLPKARGPGLAGVASTGQMPPASLGTITKAIPFPALLLFHLPGLYPQALPRPFLALPASPQMEKENDSFYFTAFLEDRNQFFYLDKTAKRPKKASWEHLREALRRRKKGSNALSHPALQIHEPP